MENNTINANSGRPVACNREYKLAKMNLSTVRNSKLQKFTNFVTKRKIFKQNVVLKQCYSYRYQQYFGSALIYKPLKPILNAVCAKVSRNDQSPYHILIIKTWSVKVKVKSTIRFTLIITLVK